MAVFFIFAMLLGAALQLTNAYGGTFLDEFSNDPAYRGPLAVKYPRSSCRSRRSRETLFILTIPFFLRASASRR